MRYTRRLIAILTAFATWCVASASVAYAMRPPDPVGGGGAAPPSSSSTSSSVGTPLWKFVAFAALVVLLVLAVAGLISSLRHARAAQPSGMLRA
jgi:hypothetical protein